MVNHGGTEGFASPGPGRDPRGAHTAEPSADLRRRRSWNPVNWSPAGAFIATNRDYRVPGTPGGRRFASTEHLASEAVAAFVDGELGMNAHLRAAEHLSLCPECVAAVEAQTAARSRLRTSGQMSIPAGLLGQLSQIPTREIDVAEVDRGLSGTGTPPAHGPVNAPTPPVAPPPGNSGGSMTGAQHTRGRMNRRWGR